VEEEKEKKEEVKKVVNAPVETYADDMAQVIGNNETGIVKKIIEEEIVNKFVTKALIEKELAKIETESGWSSKQIPRLLNTVFYCLVKEESWNFVKEFKNPIIDFKRLSFFTINRIKEVMPHLF
jgi:hypothetical protein